MPVLDREFRESWRRFVLQSLLAGGSIMLVTAALSSLPDLVIVASVGSSAFLMFSLPSRVVSSPKHVIGGHSVGIVSGVICYHINAALAPFIVPVALYGVAVTVAFLLMAAFDVDHAPAAGTALGVAVNGIRAGDAAGVLLCCAMLCALHFALKRHLKDLRREPTLGEEKGRTVVEPVQNTDDNTTL